MICHNARINGEERNDETIIMNQPYSQYTPYSNDPLQQAVVKVRQLEEENLQLRNQLFATKDEIFELQATIATIEVESKFQATQEVNNIQSQLRFKEKEFEEKNREYKRLLKELADLKKERNGSASSSSFSQQSTQPPPPPPPPPHNQYNQYNHSNSNNTIAIQKQPPTSQQQTILPSHHHNINITNNKINSNNTTNINTNTSSSSSNSNGNKKRKADEESLIAPPIALNPPLNVNVKEIIPKRSSKEEHVLIDSFAQTNLDHSDSENVQISNLNELLKEFHELLLLIMESDTANNAETNDSENVMHESSPAGRFHNAPDTTSKIKPSSAGSSSTPHAVKEVANAAIISEMAKSSSLNSAQKKSQNHSGAKGTGSGKRGTAEKFLASVSTTNIHFLLSKINRELYSLMNSMMRKDEVSSIYELSRLFYELCKYYWNLLSNFLTEVFPLEGLEEADEEILIKHLFSCATASSPLLSTSIPSSSSTPVSPSSALASYLFTIFLKSIHLFSRLFFLFLATENIYVPHAPHHSASEIELEEIHKQHQQQQQQRAKEIKALMSCVTIPSLSENQIEAAFHHAFQSPFERNPIQKEGKQIKEHWKYFFHELIEWNQQIFSFFHQLLVFQLPTILKRWMETKFPTEEKMKQKEKPRDLTVPAGVSMMTSMTARLTVLAPVTADYWSDWLIYLHQQTIQESLLIVQTIYHHRSRLLVLQSGDLFPTPSETARIKSLLQSFSNIFLPLLQSAASPSVQAQQSNAADYFYIILSSSFLPWSLKEEALTFLQDLLLEDDRALRIFVKHQYQYRVDITPAPSSSNKIGASSMKREVSDGAISSSNSQTIKIGSHDGIFLLLSSILWNESKCAKNNFPSSSNEELFCAIYNYHTKIVRFFHRLLNKYKDLMIGIWLHFPYDILFSMEEEDANSLFDDVPLLDEEPPLPPQEQDEDEKYFLEDSEMDFETTRGTKKRLASAIHKSSSRPPAITKPSSSSSSSAAIAAPSSSTTKANHQNKFKLNQHVEVYFTQIDRILFTRLLKSWSFHWIFLEKIDLMEEEDQSSSDEQYQQYLRYTTILINTMMQVIARRSYQQIILKESMVYIEAFLGRILLNRFSESQIPWKEKDIYYIEQILLDKE